MSETVFTVNITEVISEFKLEFINEDAVEPSVVACSELNRPGLALNGYYEVFENERIQIIGKAEYSYINTIDPLTRRDAFLKLASQKIPAIIVTRNQEIYPDLIEACNIYGIPLLRTDMPSSRFMAALISYLNVQLAPRITRHGVLVEVYGEGVLILGESGVGKSETAIELVKRGHRLVADDAVEIKRVSDRTLVGSSPAIIRHFIELRGIGIVDVRRIFGMGAIKETEKIDMVVNLEVWNEKKYYDRLGLVTEYMDILGLQIPCLNIPVRPGRNLAVVLEVAAMNNRQKKLGYNPAEELNQRLQQKMNQNGEE